MQDLKELTFACMQNVAKTWLKHNKYLPKVLSRDHRLIVFSSFLRNWISLDEIPLKVLIFALI